MGTAVAEGQDPEGIERAVLSTMDTLEAGIWLPSQPTASPA